RIESRAEEAAVENGEIHHHVKIQNPQGAERERVVILTPVLQESVKHYISGKPLPDGKRFWRALAEEVVANYVWQLSEFPPEEEIVADRLTTSMKRGIDSGRSRGAQ